MGEEKQSCECVQTGLLSRIETCIAQHEERLRDGDLKFQKMILQNEALLEGQRESQDTLERFNKRLFVDNGTTSVQTKIDRHNVMLKGMMYAITSVSVVVATVVIKLIINAVFK